MSSRIKSLWLLIMIFHQLSFALEPDEIIVIANSEIPASVRIAQYYCQKRSVPDDNLFALPLGKNLETQISRNDYNTKLVQPLRTRLNDEKYAGKIRCLLTTYGVPINLGGRGQLEGGESEIRHLQELIDEEKKKLEDVNNLSAEESTSINTKISLIELQVDMINGKETSASVDSELSMVLIKDYELYRWQINLLGPLLNVAVDINDLFDAGLGTLMVSRLDGPGEDIVAALVDKAISAERTGLKGKAYFDSRGITSDTQYGLYDKSLRDLAVVTKLSTDLPVEEERTDKLFASGDCPQTAIYCGWYSLKKYIDAFDFVDGAVGFHIASFEAVDIRNPEATPWCPAMLVDGITATLGAVNEPYLHTFPEPRAFFLELYSGKCLVEAYYNTNPYNSWQILLIGDPLYRPFKKTD
ncbi:TIGR03790 family protein [Planctomycetota bacterium]